MVRAADLVQVLRFPRPAKGQPARALVGTGRYGVAHRLRLTVLRVAARRRRARRPLVVPFPCPFAHDRLLQPSSMPRMRPATVKSMTSPAASASVEMSGDDPTPGSSFKRLLALRRGAP